MEYTSAGLMEHHQDNMYKMRSELRIGLCLSRFLKEIDTTPSNIGVIKEDEGNKGSFLRIVGLQLEAFETPADLLSDSLVSMSAKKKFRNYNGSQASTLLSQYLKFAGESKEVREELVTKLKNIESNKELMLPIKPGTLCRMEIERAKMSDTEQKDEADSGNKSGSVIKSSKIEVIKWNIDPKSGALKCFVITEALDAITRVRGRCEIADYGNKFFLTDIENAMTNHSSGTAKKEHKFIKMSNLGYILPIRIENSEGNGFIVDNNYIYSLTNGSEPLPIAYWDERNNIVGDVDYHRITKLPIFKELEKGLDFIAQHRRFIGPYFLVPENIINVK